MCSKASLLVGVQSLLRHSFTPTLINFIFFSLLIMGGSNWKYICMYRNSYKMMIEASQGVMEDRILEEAIEIHLKTVNEVQGNTLNLVGMKIKETKDNFCKFKEMTIDRDQEIGEMMNS